ncbi:hypothetical protein BF49_0360 [Bradyrhizobium sp.]|uniref:hypothetical protein n=1 Tax=Bradyrhizobium sp. TaxID=376 RepID=UPI0007C1E3D8|nr:hypothetical protein [Bradyrhizobium sp.]CUT09280.1 hypothetical protein BF49_0360 [Bradyrhizobium sp.]
MPTDTLAEEAQSGLKAANQILRSKRIDADARKQSVMRLKNLDDRLCHDIGIREDDYLGELQEKEDVEINAKWAQLNNNQKYLRVSAEQKAGDQTFQELRQVNGGAYPRNLSPVIYVIPLIGIGIAEWYVNLSTFMAKFVPLVAGAGTILVAMIFAISSHFHGEYLKQIAEILHPSVDYRNELGRKLSVLIATMLLLCALGVVVWLRYQAISEQLGLNSDAPGTFGGSNSSLVWQNLGPTIGMNLFVWGVGVLYAYLASEKVPHLREAYRALLRANKKLHRARQPFEREQTRITAFYQRERQKNEVVLKEYKNLSEEIKGALARLEA